MRAGIGNDRLVVCLSEYLPLRIVYRISSMSTIGKCFVSRIYRRILITQESSRKSCSLAGGFVPTRSHRGGRARRYLVVIRVLAFVSSGVMISINSIDVHIGHESSVGVYLAKRSRIYRIGNTP